MFLAQGQNTAPPVGIEPKTSRFEFRCSAITSPRSPKHQICQIRREQMGKKIKLLFPERGHSDFYFVNGTKIHG